jgi:peptidoglycan/xylan/chitin deacetylase (PgdA/CDA1 family)
VTNEFVNVRESPTITAPLVMRLDRGALVTLVEFINAAWAKVEYAAGKQGYIVSRYIAKLATEEKLTADKEQFKGLYFVNFGFVNVRKEPNAQSEKLGELPGQSFVRPLSMDEVWARIPFQGKEGYVAVQYLSPFLPNFLVRQEKYMLPILHYTLADDTQLPALRAHVARLRAEGFKILTLRAFYDLLLAQEQRDVRLDPKSVVLVISGITPGNARAVSEGLLADTIRATLFIETRHIGLSGITEKMLLTLIANGHDLESAGHTGDDLRSLTNAQLELELKQSRKILEDLTGKTVFAIAYPQGGVNERVMQKASEAGYLLGLSNVPERTVTRAQFLRLPSFTISFGLTADDIVKIARGT